MSENNHSVIRDLLDRVSELSQIISPQSTDEINSEVRRVFTTRRQTLQNSQPPQTNSQPVAPAPYQQRQAASAAQLPQQISGLTSESRLPFRGNTAFQTRRYFPASRPVTNSRRRGNRTQQQTPDNRPFLRDLILLSSPEDEVVPRQGARLLLMENGHIISGVRFSKDLSAAAIETCIIEAFDGKIPSDVDIEIMASVHSSLVAPALVPGQLLDGVMIHRIFRQKPLYIRPSRRLLETGDIRQVLLNFMFFKY